MFPAKTKSPLASAEKAAQTYSDSQPVGATTMPCSNAQKELKEVIRVKVVGEDGVGLEDIALQLSRDDKQVLTGKTAPDGAYAFKGLEPGAYQLSLSELDQDAWKEVKTAALPADEAKTSSQANWQSPTAPSERAGFTHTVIQGECVAKLAEQHGLFAETVWQHANNQALRDKRKLMHILAPGDALFIPPNTLKAISVNTGQQLELKRKGIPESLNIRFLNYDGTPRIGSPYLVSIKTGGDEVLADVRGTTNEGGFVRAAISPKAIFATIILGEGEFKETYNFDLGYINPIDTWSGVKARLNSLGYQCGAETDEPNEQSQAALKHFQRRYKLEPTGEKDDATLALLMERFGS